MGETASKAKQSFKPTAGSEPGGGFLLLSPPQRRSSRRTREWKSGAQVMNQENVLEEAAEPSPAARQGAALLSGWLPSGNGSPLGSSRRRWKSWKLPPCLSLRQNSS